MLTFLHAAQPTVRPDTVGFMCRTHAARMVAIPSAVRGHKTNISPFGKGTDLIYGNALKMWRMRI